MTEKKIDGVSEATRRNWRRLGVSLETKRLDRRANKQFSRRRFLPVEYLRCPDLKSAIETLSDFFDHCFEDPTRSIPFLCREYLIHRGLVSLTEKGGMAPKNPFLFRFVQKLSEKIDPEFATRVRHEVAGPLAALCGTTGEFDPLGAFYQTILSEGNKNRKGSYFTPPSIAERMIDPLDLVPTDRIFDPACGTGAFLLMAIENLQKKTSPPHDEKRGSGRKVGKGEKPSEKTGIDPRNLIGVDSDPLAVMIAKTNLFVAFPEERFHPAIFCRDFLLSDGRETGKEWEEKPGAKTPDVIVANPPWGAKGTGIYRESFPEVPSGERFSLFLAKSIDQLPVGGRLSFLLPLSFLRIRRHADIRRKVLDSLDIHRIQEFDRKFSGVTTGVVSLIGIKKSDSLPTTSPIKGKKGIVSGGGTDSSVVSPPPSTIGEPRESSSEGESSILIERPSDRFHVSPRFLRRPPEFLFSLVPDEDQTLLDRIYDRPYETLSDSFWGLGIVTGDNANKLSTTPFPEGEPIITGREILPYRIKDARFFLHFDRENFQQVAPESIYRTRPKLIYRFIADRPVFAYDDSGRLTLNSANVLIPRLSSMSVKSALAFLNSDLFRFIYQKRFGDVKVLKGNLARLPFPLLDAETDRVLSALVDRILSAEFPKEPEIEPTANGGAERGTERELERGTSLHREIQGVIQKIFGYSDEDRKRIEKISRR